MLFVVPEAFVLVLVLKPFQEVFQAFELSARPGAVHFH